jgi:hypothetical protein
MVSIRKPAMAVQHHQHGKSKAWLSLRTVIIGIVVWQALSFVYYKAWSPASPSLKSSPLQRVPLPPKQPLQRVEQQSPIKPKLPPIKVNSIPEMPHNPPQPQRNEQAHIPPPPAAAAAGKEADADDGATAKDGAHSPEEPELDREAVLQKEKEQQQEHQPPGQAEEEEEEEVALEPKGLPPPVPKIAAAAANNGIVTLGTGPTKNGYVVDFVHERESEAFRTQAFAPHYEATEAKVSAQLSVPVKHCETISPTSRRLTQSSQCLDVKTGLYVYNGAWFARSFCGALVEPGHAIAITELCAEPIRLFPHPEMVPITGQGMPPIKVQSQPIHHTEDAGLFTSIECDIACQWENDMQGTERYIDGMPWKLQVVPDDPNFNDNAKVERTAYRRDIYYSTTSLTSSIPLSYYDAEKYNFRKAPALAWDKAANKATYLLNDGCMAGTNRRHRWVEAIQKHLSVEAYGQCQHTMDLAPGETIQTLEGRVALARKNRIVLAFESGTEKDYMTSITWEAFLSGAVPAIMGASNAASLLPSHSFIDGSGFNDYDKFATYIQQVSENRTLWESYHAWRKDEAAIQALEDAFEFTHTSSQCRTCRWAFAKMYGLGWNHKRQVVQESHLPRNLCVAQETHLVTKPFYEVWQELGVEKSHEGVAEFCQKDDMQQIITIEQDNYKIVREIAHHDGVTDMLIQSVENEEAKDDIVLRLEFGVRNYEGAYFRNTHVLVATERGGFATSISIQDSQAKVTVLANWETKMRSPHPGAIDVIITKKDETVLPGENRRLRVIVEDMNPLHDKVTEFFPSSFGQRMTKDFIDPLEYFYKA